MVSVRFPQDLVELQCARHRAYEELAGGPADPTAVRRRLLWLSARLFWHPLFDASAGGSPAARVELCRQAREAGGLGAATRGSSSRSDC